MSLLFSISSTLRSTRAQSAWTDELTNRSGNEAYVRPPPASPGNDEKITTYVLILKTNYLVISRSPMNVLTIIHV